jgi:catechol 2,3-dioxygenase-like lactoylglutathione lyase family enzyme
MPTPTLQVVFDCADPARQAAFWSATLGYRMPDPPDGFPDWQAWAAAQEIPEERWNDVSAIEDPTGTRPRVFFQKVPEEKTAKNRVHLDVGVSGGPGVALEERRRLVDAEVVRLKALGATDGRGPMERLGEYWVRMNDPEGNEFCVQ